ncbi:type IV secretory system conjugative DNA transfer family protein [Jiella mangrovi]|uniref:Type IV secretory system conjugative DNA transfer family protein n=1 Tax=Jiella mangrovi TaxID=2821407 RepID=A0ABS4BNG0_9HYPH|nr:type IV secretory system conjugative DNA transfer family protein [Jiella mangrovi]MBP0618273.1 type IV secretory system conjugative DNA transfer family protein [Jiella mangrovi]
MDVIKGLLTLLLTLCRGSAWLIIKSGKCALWLLRWVWSRRRSTTFGSARWASLWQILRGGALGGHGIIVGKVYNQLLRFTGEGAVLVYAPQGSGKGVGIVIPNILDYPGALVVTDPKGENASITRKYRKELGPVFELSVVAPERSNQFNPFSMIRRGTPWEPDDISTLAQLVVTPESNEAHWDTSARNLIAAVIGYVLHSYPPEEQNLSKVRELIADEGDGFRRTLEAMVATDISTIAEEARSYLGSLDLPETLSVKKNATKSLAIWSRDRIAGQLSVRSDFDMMDLHKQVMTVYVIVPEDFLEIYAPFMRVMMGCAVNAMVRAKDLPRPKHKPLLLFDECATLKRLDALANGMGFLREYARTILIFQDLGQLRGIYGEEVARSFISASGAQVAFNVNDNLTAQELADAIGMTTVRARSDGRSHANTDLYRMQQQAGQSEAGRYLKDASEVRRIKRNQALVFLSTVKGPILATKVRYYRVFRWRDRYESWRSGSKTSDANLVPIPRILPTHEREAASPEHSPAARERAA